MFGGTGLGFSGRASFTTTEAISPTTIDGHQHVVGGTEEAERIVPPEPEAALRPVEQVAEPEVDAGEGEKHRARRRHQEEARRDGVGAEEAEEAHAVSP